MQPEILLLDKPFASLDENMVKRMVNILRKISQSYIIVSHNKELLAKVTGDFYYLKKDF